MIEIENAYHRIESVEGNKEQVIVKLVTHTNDLTHQVDVNFYQFEPSNDENASRWDKQAYEHLKTLNEFDGAIDV